MRAARDFTMTSWLYLPSMLASCRNDGMHVCISADTYSSSSRSAGVPTGRSNCIVMVISPPLHHCYAPNFWQQYQVSTSPLSSCRFVLRKLPPADKKADVRRSLPFSTEAREGGPACMSRRGLQEAILLGKSLHILPLDHRSYHHFFPWQNDETVVVVLASCCRC